MKFYKFVGIIPAILVENTVLKRDHWSNYMYLFIDKLMVYELVNVVMIFRFYLEISVNKTCPCKSVNLYMYNVIGIDFI